MHIDTDQKVEVSLGDLISSLKTNDVPAKAEPEVSTDEYMRLAKLKIEGVFKPKIKAAKLRAEKMNQARLDSLDIDAKSCVAAEAKKRVSELNKLHLDANKLSSRIKELTDKSVETLPVLEILSTEVRSIDLEEVSGKVNCGTLSFNFPVATPTGIKAAIKKRDEAAKAHTKAQEDYAILCKSRETALTEIVSEVEAGLIQYKIEKSKEAMDLAKSINDRVDKFQSTNLLNG